VRHSRPSNSIESWAGVSVIEVVLRIFPGSSAVLVLNVTQFHPW